jgi:hypothetical protein
MEATPPATPRHTMFPLWLLPSGSDQVACQHARVSSQTIWGKGFTLMRLPDFYRANTERGQSFF